MHLNFFAPPVDRDSYRRQALILYVLEPVGSSGLKLEGPMMRVGRRGELLGSIRRSGTEAAPPVRGGAVSRSKLRNRETPARRLAGPYYLF